MAQPPQPRSDLPGTPCMIQQNIINRYTPTINALTVGEAKFSPRHLEWLFAERRNSLHCVGVSGAYSPTKHTLSALALAVNYEASGKKYANVLIIELSSATSPKITRAREHFQRTVLCSDPHYIFAFDLAPLCLLLHMHYSLHITTGIDIQSALSLDCRIPLASIRYALGDNTELNADNVTAVFKEQEYSQKTLSELIQRAWVSAYLGGLEDIFGGIYNPDSPKISTKRLPEPHLQLLEKLASDKHMLASLIPSITSNDFSDTQWDRKKKTLNTQNSRFQTRMHSESNAIVQVKTKDGTFLTSAQSLEVVGKKAVLKFDGNLSLEGKEIATITSGNRATPTAAEAKLAEEILLILQGKMELNNPWIHTIWNLPGPLPEFDHPAPTTVTPSEPIALATINPQYPINFSQETAVTAMLSSAPEDRITIIQGPPGTGKTSVIATYVLTAIEAGHKGIWLMAQSNVAVKNIAEKLLDVGFVDWRLLVSADFHFDWHEHLYRQINSKTLPSDKWPKSPAAVERELGPSQVILCTLSMISNPRLVDLGFTKVVPPISIVIDEASQITIGDYFPMLYSFGKTIRQLSFIGDNKQLPPFGQEDIGDLQSIFELPHLCDRIKFLDTQYRMPPQIGDFISNQVYDHKLNSNPKHPIAKSMPACHFIDVPDGVERKDRTSWINKQQVDAIMILAQQLEQKEISYKIISPYDAQRSLLEKALKERGLFWGNKCFNVDSFQGNEEDYIIISVVRSKDLGFLEDLRRTNVMLTRCKRGMFIFANKTFLEGKGKDCLVGKMAAEWGNDAWLEVKDVEEGKLEL